MENDSNMPIEPATPTGEKLSTMESDKYKYIYLQLHKLLDKYKEFPYCMHIMQELMIQYCLAIHNQNKAMTADVLERYMLKDLQGDIERLRNEHLLETADTTKPQ